MSLWNSWLPRAPGEEDAERVPMPQVGEIVRIQVAGDAHVGVYQARVRALGMRRIFLDSAEAISHADAVPNLPSRASLTLSYVRADNLYQCQTRVIQTTKPGSLTIARPRVVTRVQRRNFYRLPLQSPTTFRVRGDTGSTPPLAARLVNLSGGGALLAASKPVLGGLRVTVRIPAGKQGELIDVEADALDCRVATQGLSRIYLVRLRFLTPPDLSEEDRDEIVAYIFEQQRVLLRNRKLLRA